MPFENCTKHYDDAVVVLLFIKGKNFAKKSNNLPIDLFRIHWNCLVSKYHHCFQKTFLKYVCRPFRCFLTIFMQNYTASVVCLYLWKKAQILLWIILKKKKRKYLKNEFVSGSMRMRKLRTTNGSMKPKKKKKEKKVVKRKKKMMMTMMMPKFQIHSVLTHHRKHRQT